MWPKPECSSHVPRPPFRKRGHSQLSKSAAGARGSLRTHPRGCYDRAQHAKDNAFPPGAWIWGVIVQDPSHQPRLRLLEGSVITAPASGTQSPSTLRKHAPPGASLCIHLALDWKSPSSCPNPACACSHVWMERPNSGSHGSDWRQHTVLPKRKNTTFWAVCDEQCGFRWL